MDVADIFSDLNDHGFEDTSTARKLEILNDVYHDVCSREPWPFLELVDVTPSLAANVVTADSPIRAVLFLRTKSRELRPMRMDDMMRQFGSDLTKTGEPYLYYFVGSELRIYPQPATTPEGLTLAYIRREIDLNSDDVENEILLPSEWHRSVLVNGCLYKLYALEDDAELAAGFQRYYEEGIARMREAIWRRQYQRGEIVLEDGYDGLYEPGGWY